MSAGKPVAVPISSEVLFYWLDYMLSNEEIYAEWTNVAADQREHWLEERGYCYSELRQTIQSLTYSDINQPLVQALVDFLIQGLPIPIRLVQPLEALAHQCILATDALAGGVYSGSKFKQEALRRFSPIVKGAKSSLSEVYDAYQIASESKLGEYIEIGGGIEIDAHKYLENQLETKNIKAHDFIASKAKPALESLLHTQKTDLQLEKERYITQTTDNAVQKESILISEEKAALSPDKVHKLGPKEHQIEIINKQYYDHTYRSKVQSGFIDKPTIVNSSNGIAPELTVTYDWKGDRSTYVLNRTTAAADLDPASYVVDKSTARALEHQIETIDKQYYDHTYRSKVQKIETIDKQYYDHTYRSKVQSGFIDKPTIVNSSNGIAPELTVTYDWKGDRSTYVLNRTTAAADLDPALYVVDKFTARALWNAKVKADYKSDFSADIKHYASLDVDVTSDLQKFQKHFYPKAKLPQTLKQFNQEKTALHKSLKTKQRKAQRHGVTLLSLQRHCDQKRIKSNVQSWQVVQGKNAYAEAKLAVNNNYTSKLHQEYAHFQIDRMIEFKLTSEYGSLRSQKLILNQARIDVAAFQNFQKDMEPSFKRLIKLNYLIRHGDLNSNKKRSNIYHKGGPGKIGQIATGILDAQIFKLDLKQCISTSPYKIQKNSNGKGYSFVPSTYNKDYWQKLTEKQRYNIFNPAYKSETSFYNTEKIAFLAGSSTYLDLRRTGATKKTARLAASAVYFTTLFEVDKAGVRSESKASKLAFAPFIFERQLHVAKQVVHLNRHSFAWKLRVAFKVKRETLIFKESSKEDKYMKNNKFTGFHPFHRIARKTVKWTKLIWHYTLGPIYSHEVKWFNEAMGGIFGSKTQKWLANAEKKTASSVLFLGWHVVKGLWHLPERLYHHTIYFGKQLLFAITHPWAYRKIWTGIKKDFRGIWHLGKFIYHVVAWTLSVYGRVFYQIGRAIGGKGNNWKSVFKGAYHKKLYKKVSMLGKAFKFAGLATLVGKAASTRGAIQLMELRMLLRRDFHRLGFGKSPIKFFINQHSQLVQKQVKKLKPSQVSDLHKKIHSSRHYLDTHKKKLILDHHKYKVNHTYHQNVNYFFHALVRSDRALLKPKFQVYLTSTTHKLIDEISNIKNKNHKIKHWTLSQYDLDLTEYIRVRKAYKGLSKTGRKEVAASLVAFKDLNGLAKQGTIKKSMTIFNHNAKVVIDYKKSLKKTYISAVSNDWSHFGIYIGQKMFNALYFSIQSSSEKKKIKALIIKYKFGQSLFFDIVGGFEINSFISKYPFIIHRSENIGKIMHGAYVHVDSFIRQPVLKKIFLYWLKANPHSLIAKDDLWIRSYRKKLGKDFHKIQKWRDIERIGHTMVTASDLSILDTLHKNMILGQSFAALIAHTSQWKGLSLQQQQQYRTQYNHWLTYNQTSYHVLKKVKATVTTKYTSEETAWKTDKSEINSGNSMSVAGLLLSVKNDDKGKNSTWTAIPKLDPSKFSNVVNLTNIQDTFANFVSDPRLLSVAFTTNLGNGSHAKNPIKSDPSLFAYIMQIRHWSHKIKKWLGKSDKDKAKAEKEAKDAKVEEDKTKQDVAKTDKDVKDGDTTDQELLDGLATNDSTVIDKLNGNKLTKNGTQKLETDADNLIDEEEKGEISITDKNIKQAERRQTEHFQDDIRAEVEDHQVLEDIDQTTRDLRKIEKSSGDHDLESKVAEEGDEEVSSIVNQDLRSAFIGTEDDIANDAVSSVLRKTTELDEELDSAVETELELDEVVLDDLEVAILL